MNEVDNKYIEDAINRLLTTVGVKEYINHDRLISLVNSKKIKEAIKEIAKYLGLPIEVNLSYVPKGYRPGANDGFQSTHLVKTDWRGRGTGGITAQVSIPGNLPFYGTPGMINFPISIRVSENCAENPATFISVMAHELSHIVLYSLWHKEKENEFYTDLTAMMLGYGDIMRTGRKVVKTESFTDHGFLSSQTTTSTQTTTYGYLSDDNFNFAHERISKILNTYKKAKEKIIKNIKGFEKEIKKQKEESIYFRKYLEYVGKNLDQSISQQDGHWISTFHQPDYTEDFESSMRKIENELRQFTSYIKNTSQYSESRFEEIRKFEVGLKSSTADLNSKFDRVRGAVIILKKYVSTPHRIKSFLKINFSSTT
jgi:hypothetical protein